MYEITDDHREAFCHTGFFTIRGGLDREIVAEARDLAMRAVETAASGDDDYSLDLWEHVPSTEPFEEIQGSVKNYAEEFVGSGTLESQSTTTPGDKFQLPVKHPRDRTLTDPDTPRSVDLHPHVDGYGSMFEELGERQTFTIGATIYLGQVWPRGGGFTVWPGSHWIVSRYFEDHSLESLGTDHGGSPPVDVGDPFEIEGDAGTIVLWHNNLAHSAGVNRSPNYRPALVKRFSRHDHEQIKRDAADKPFKYWDAIRSVDRTGGRTAVDQC